LRDAPGGGFAVDSNRHANDRTARRPSTPKINEELTFARGRRGNALRRQIAVPGQPLPNLATDQQIAAVLG